VLIPPRDPAYGEATASQFLNYLKNVYSTPAMQQRFPRAIELIQMAIEEIQ
jgi:hypothetical protein